MNDSYDPAKLTRPKLLHVAPRCRLFRLLDKERGKPVIWISAPAGSGKTTLAASWLDARKLPCIWYQVDAGDGDIASFFYYMGLAAKNAAPRYKTPLPLLTPEYLQGVPVFTRRYFEELFRRLKPPAVLVFDNYQDAPQGSGFHEMIAHALETVPEGIRIIVLSRNNPPPQCARLLANNKLSLLGWEEIRFTLDESRDLLKTQDRKGCSAEIISTLHEKTEGWAAGLILLMGQTTGGPVGKHVIDDLSSRQIFDYFASEIFDKTAPLTQHFLLATAYLPRLTVPLARQLTGVDEAGQILDRLSAQHYFTQRYAHGEPVYQYHPLFREFLLARASGYFDTAERLSIKRKAAALLQSAGRDEEAVALFVLANDWPAVIGLILRHAHSLVAQGRSKTLEDWIRFVPEDVRMNDAWLLYWAGVCRMPFDPRESRNLLERAFDRFRAGQDATGVFLSWANIIDTFGYEWGDFIAVDRWIAVIEELLPVHPRFPSPEIEARVAAGMFNALTWRRPLHPDLPKWADKIMQMVLHGPSNQLRMMLGNNLLFYYLWSDDSAKAAVIINTLKPLSRSADNDPLTQVMWYLMAAMYAWLMNDPATCYAAVSEGKHLADRAGVHLLDELLLSMGCECSMSAGDIDRAATYLNDISSLNITRLMDRVQYQHLCGSVAWGKGDWHSALRYGENAVKLVAETGHYLGQSVMEEALAVALYDMGKKAEAGIYLDRALDSGKGIKRVEFCCKIQKARFALESGSEEGVAFLREAMSLGAQYGYVNFIRWSSNVMSRLCAKALEHGIEPDYVVKLIRTHKLSPPEEAYELDSWPYPIRITTLGRFQIVKDGEPVTFTGKVQKKPLEMLKALISFGGTDVSEERITEALWPDADGDAAHRSFESALYRLRKLVGENTVRLQDGLLAIDRRYCRVDAWDFSRFAQEGTGIIGSEREKAKGKTRAGSRSACAEIPRPAEKALELYRGPFLPADLNQPWSLSLRERLRDCFIGLVNGLGRSWEESGEWERASACFRKGLETEEYAEEFYQHLMVCHRELGQHAQAEAVYRQCRAALSQTLGLAPSPKTEELRASLQKNQ